MPSNTIRSGLRLRETVPPISDSTNTGAEQRANHDRNSFRPSLTGPGQKFAGFG